MKKLVYDGWHKIEEVEVEVKGEVVKRELLHLKSAVAAIVTDKQNRIALVSQYRPALGMQILEIPAGVIDKPHLSNVETLVEELEEECEISKRDILEVTQTKPEGYYMVSGSSEAYLHLYRVKVSCEKDEVYPVSDADVDYVVWMEFDEFEKRVMRGEIVDSKTLFAYFVLKGERVA